MKDLAAGDADGARCSAAVDYRGSHVVGSQLTRAVCSRLEQANMSPSVNSLPLTFT